MYLCKLSASLMLLGCSMASCQVSLHQESGSPTRGDFYAGGAFTGSNPSNATTGFGGGAAFRLYRMVGIAAEFDSYIGTSGVANSTALYDYLVGPRISFNRSARLSAFADFLGGGQYLHNGSTQHSYYYGNGGGAALAADGGVDVRLTRHLAFRAQVGFVHSSFATTPTTTSNDRWRAGTFLVFRF